MLGGTPDSGSWTTVGIKKIAPGAPAHAVSPAPLPPELPRPVASPSQAARAACGGPAGPAAGQQRASLQALAAARSQTANMLKAQVIAGRRAMLALCWAWGNPLGCSRCFLGRLGLVLSAREEFMQVGLAECIVCTAGHLREARQRRGSACPSPRSRQLSMEQSRAGPVCKIRW